MSNNVISLKQWIKSHKLGYSKAYDYRYFKKMSSLKSKMFKKLDSVPEQDVAKALYHAGILGKGKRLTKIRNRQGYKVWDYTTGQSFNEELVNIATIGATKGKKSFWNLSENWMEDIYEAEERKKKLNKWISDKWH